jgi:novobiocin biosynthesis protein NovU/D-mycarose 3-C-methyltransferase
VTALANRFLRPEQLTEAEPRYPLRVVLCDRCGLVQLDEEVPREILFKDYIYVTGTSDLVHEHTLGLAQTLCRRYQLTPRDLVLEAASNDGTGLKAFRNRGVRVLGVEPAANIATQAEQDGIPTVVDYFDARLARQLRAEHGPARLFLARHVLAHVTDLHGFVRGIRLLLAEDGVAVIEVPHLAALYEKLAFDTIYHEHLCYFSLSVLRTLFGQFGLRVIDVARVPIHGGSLVVQVAHESGPFQPTQAISAVLHREARLQLDRIRTWQGFARRVEHSREALWAFIGELNRKGQTRAGYGAPAKANTLLAYAGIGPEQLPYIVDKSPQKQGLFTPGQHIPVHAPDRLGRDQPDVTLILAWNFAEEIVRQQTDYRQRGGRFAVPIPTPSLIGAAAA